MQVHVWVVGAVDSSAGPSMTLDIPNKTQVMAWLLMGTQVLLGKPILKTHTENACLQVSWVGWDSSGLLFAAAAKNELLLW